RTGVTVSRTPAPEPNKSRHVCLQQDLAAFLHAEQCGGAAARDSDCGIPVAVLVEDELAVRAVGERPRSDRVVAVPTRRELDAHPRHDPDAVEMAAVEIERDVPEAVDP